MARHSLNYRAHVGAALIALLLLLLPASLQEYGVTKGQGGAGRATAKPSTPPAVKKTAPAKPRIRAIRTPTVDPAPATDPAAPITEMIAVRARASELCYRTTDRMTLSELDWMEQQPSVTQSPGPGCNDLPLITEKTCKVWLRLIDAPSTAQCPPQSGKRINENDNLLMQMVFREYLKGRRQWPNSLGIECSGSDCYLSPFRMQR